MGLIRKRSKTAVIRYYYNQYDEKEKGYQTLLLFHAYGHNSNYIQNEAYIYNSNISDIFSEENTKKENNY